MSENASEINGSTAPSNPEARMEDDGDLNEKEEKVPSSLLYFFDDYEIRGKHFFLQLFKIFLNYP